MKLLGISAASKIWRPALLCAALTLTTACSNGSLSHSTKGAPDTGATRSYFIDPTRQAEAIKEAKVKRAKGQRVWCVPFARTMSGVHLRGNAGTWWSAAAGAYDRGHDPAVGSVMAFSSTKKMPMGHVAVVSEVVSPRQILIDHANWNRNQVSLKMPVIDVSEKNDWSRVRVANGSVYPIHGFIYPTALSKAPVEAAVEEDAADATAPEQATEAAVTEVSTEAATEAAAVAEPLPVQTASVNG